MKVLLYTECLQRVEILIGYLYCQYTRPHTWLACLRLLGAPMLLLYLTLILVLLPRTRWVRVALAPFTLYLIGGATLFVDFTALTDNPAAPTMNYALSIILGYTAMRVCTLGIPSDPYTRKEPTFRRDSILLEALDLSCNFRGVGWSWSDEVMEFSPTQRSAETFLRQTLLSLLVHTAILILPIPIVATLLHPGSSTIFHPDIVPFQRYASAAVITLLNGISGYATIQLVYDSSTLFALIVLQHTPNQWPPLFNRPWLATSVSDLWSRRWHQILRHNLYHLTYRPFGLMSVFILSGLMHTHQLASLHNGIGWGNMIFFLMMGVGMAMERCWKQIFGAHVDGCFGRLWTVLWVGGWGMILVDEWVRRGLV